MTTATRERKLKFIRARTRIIDAVERSLILDGTDWLTEDQIDSIVVDEIREQRSAQRRNRQNRRRAA